MGFRAASTFIWRKLPKWKSEFVRNNGQPGERERHAVP
jgi:hypothetical protein